MVICAEQRDVICAPATMAGGAISVIKISGTGCWDILYKIFSKDISAAKPNTVHYGRIMTPSVHAGETEIVDEVLVTLFKAPHSYTGEDYAEISCHGSSYIVKRIMELLISSGCLQAQPGEFTQRAYLNGKMDLSQAEAVADLIAASNKAMHRIAMSQLRGNFSSELSRLREKLLKLTSLLELELDFSDHEDLEFADRTELLTLAQDIDRRLVSLAKSFETGQALKEGIPVCIVGKTNVGKSTLLNCLLKDERAIVSDVHGTTRDTIEDCINISGITFRIIDTAGIRQTDDTVEKIGIDRTYQAIGRARIVLWVIDKMPEEAELRDIHQRTKDKQLIIVWNKADISAPPSQTSWEYIPVSAKENENIEALEHAIRHSACIPEIHEEDIIITSSRHYEALTKAHENISLVIQGLQSALSGDLLAEDLRLVLSDLSNITGGQITPQETLNNIFKYFCVGK